MNLLERLDARVLLDAPCGDMNWVGEVADSVDEYIGVDIVRELIRKKRCSAQPLEAPLPSRRLDQGPTSQGRCILCRDALVHFADDDVWSALRNLKRSGSRFLLTTTFIDRAKNTPIPTGSWRPLNLQRAPFCFEAPLSLIDEHCLHTNGIYRDKRLALWDLASVPDGPTKEKDSRN